MVTRAYEGMDEKDRQLFRLLIQDAGYSGGKLAEILTTAFKGKHVIDRMAVDHFRRKLRIGKATL